MKVLGTIVFVFLTINLNAQVWFDLGLKGGVGSGFILNKTLSNDTRLSPSPGFNFFYGGKVGVNFGEAVGITTDFTLNENSYSFLQADLGGSTTSVKYQISLSTFSIAPLFRLTKEASYLEVGPQFSFLRGGSINTGLASNQPEDYIRQRSTRLIFGFGGHMVGNEIISLMMGLRASYNLSELANDNYAGTTWPFNNYLDISEANATRALDIQIVMELNYSLGYFVRASCGKRTAFLTF